jgi:hypothetical protein
VNLKPKPNAYLFCFFNILKMARIL